MTDLEMVKKCAARMGYMPDVNWVEPKYDPINNDAQAMALVKKLELSITKPSNYWYVTDGLGVYGEDKELNRAIVHCVANLPE
jgi:hypothetical protein